MWRAMMAVLVALAVGFAADSAAAAGGEFFSNPPTLSDGFSLPGVLSAHWKIAEMDNNQVNAGISLNLEDGLQFERAGWSFCSDYFDPSHWWAYFSATGYILGPGEEMKGVTFGQSGRISQGGVSLFLGSNAGEGMEFYESGEIVRYQSLSGDFLLSPADISYANFDYQEHAEDWNDPSRIRWYASFQVHGQFVAPTLGEAQAMGVPFVPEPATLCLLGLGVSALLFKRRQ